MDQGIRKKEAESETVKDKEWRETIFLKCPIDIEKVFQWNKREYSVSLMIGDTGGKYFTPDILIWYILCSSKSGLRDLGELWHKEKLASS